MGSRFKRYRATRNHETNCSQQNERRGRSSELYLPSSLWIILCVILLFSTVIKLPTLRFSHTELDEQVYLSLAARLLSSGVYNLQETQVLYDLSPGIYDRPLFFHPPLFPLMLIPFLHWKIPEFGVVVSWLGHLLSISAVALMGRRLARENDLEAKGGPLLEWLPVIGVGLDPLMVFVSRRLWIDGLLTGLCAMSIAALFCARFSGRRQMWLVAGGALFGLAAMAKITALILAPLLVFLVLTPSGLRRSGMRDVVLAGLPFLLLTLPWFIIFYRTYGTLFPYWIKPDDWTLQHYPFVRAALERTPTFYLTKLVAIAPVTIWSVFAYCLRRRFWVNATSVLAPVWFLIYFAGISYVGWRGMGFQMRYLAPLVPSVYLMLYPVLSFTRPGRSALVVGVLLALFFGAMTSAIYLISPHFDEIYSLFELARIAGSTS